MTEKKENKKKKKKEESLFKLIDLVTEQEKIMKYPVIMMKLSSVGLYKQYKEELKNPNIVKQTITKSYFKSIMED